MKSAKPVSDRFWAKVDKKAPSECWEWTSGLFKNGYGRFYYNADNRTAYAHRVSYELVNGAISPGSVILHTCDNPKCVNPAHLTEGDQNANMKDMAAKGRSAKGIKNAASKVNATQVEEIRYKYKLGGYLQSTLAAEYGITQSAVSHIVNNSTWSN